VVTAATPKGERRRQALVDAATDLFIEGGFSAVRHRSVAARAQLPLASTTYYFESLDDLIAAAVERLGDRDLEAMREYLDGLPHRKRGEEATVELLLDLLVGDAETDDDREVLTARIEGSIAGSRNEVLRDAQARLRAEQIEIVGEAFDRSGREGDADKLIAVIDGALVSGLGEQVEDVRDYVRGILTDVLPTLVK
jgi:DNA-binding transcriptional regulator YbjK